jgi:hypothetical protein
MDYRKNKKKCPDHLANMEGRPIDHFYCVAYECPFHIGKRKQKQLIRKRWPYDE